jgi:tight adherence protein C
MSSAVLLFLGLSGIFGSILLVLGTVGGITSERKQVTRSLAAIQRSHRGGVVEEDAQLPFFDRVLAPAFNRLVGIGTRFSPSGIVGPIGRRLDVAGNPDGWTVERILGYKGLGLIGGTAFGVLTGSGFGLAGMVVLAAGFGVLGFFLPDILTYNSGLKRQDAIRKALPDAIDLLTISVEAGLGFDAALSQVARNTEGPLAGEFFRVLQEMQIGKGRSEALRALGERTTIAELRGFVGAMVQADTFGIAIANVLRAQSKEMRIKRYQRAEEAAGKVPVKILFPLIFFILPALFVVVMGPGVLSIIDAFSR